MRGQLLQRSPGSWTIVLYVGRDGSGRKVYRQHTVHGTKREAERERTRLLRALDTGVYLEPSRQTVGEYLERWLDDYARHHVAARTYEFYADIVRRKLIPALGHIPLVRLTPQDIKTFYARALELGRANGKGGLSGTTVLGFHRTLHAALKCACDDGLLVANPADRVPTPRKSRREMATLDEAETVRLLEVVKRSELHIPVLLAIATGLRRGEILGLRWADVDFGRPALSVRQTLQATREGLVFAPPKTEKSKRLVSLPGFAVAALREHKRTQAEHRLQLGPAYHNHDLVCAGPDGRPIHPDWLSCAFFRFIRDSGLPRVRFHDLRHTHATLLLAHDVHPKIASERLGHSTVGLTMDTYSHVLPGMQEQAALTLEKALKGSGDA